MLCRLETLRRVLNALFGGRMQFSKAKPGSLISSRFVPQPHAFMVPLIGCITIWTLGSCLLYTSDAADE